MKNLFLIIATILLSSCYGMADYNGPPPNAQNAGLKPIDPETLRVNSKEYPVFQVNEVATPPIPLSEYNPAEFAVGNRFMADLLPTDRWNVTYKWMDYYLITSETYIERQCEFYNECNRGIFNKKPQPYYLYAIYVNKDGKVSGGWKLLKNPNIVGLSSDRKTYFNPSENRNTGWEKIKFEKIK